jgi:ABC-type dipeptide/oligopeptide/nickel transport system ATPase component
VSDIVRIHDLVVDYSTEARVVRALDGATLSVAPGETLGIVGESGSGKSTLGLVLGRLLPSNAVFPRGSVEVDGHDVLGLDRLALRQLRHDCLGFIPQDPIGALDPTMRIGAQMRLALRRMPHDKRALLAHLEGVRLTDPERILRLFPHEVSGGMAQRVLIAIAMARKPRVLVADEPTAALDSKVRSEVTELVFGLAARAGTTVLWLSHDLRSVGRWCERVAVMHSGRVVEDGAAREVLEHPQHPYTANLAASDPVRAAWGERIETTAMNLSSISGTQEGIRHV